ncbi:hypothetical protein LXH13_11470 [Streptomyces spinosirectus]|uniref:hypothetical protein n=1 Tax=Streptomyces TaxID=1883 RepID=UPI000D38720F|nr:MULTISPECIES: hypothetical protein [Streptomyces]UIR17615.1 hypothetical protein LXH13_11470 [Streptomyces spinosirectus]
MGAGRAVPRAPRSQVRSGGPGFCLQGPRASLGADGFGLSDTRDAARRHFGVDAPSIVVAALAQLARRGEVKATAVKEARERYGL